MGEVGLLCYGISLRNRKAFWSSGSRVQSTLFCFVPPKYTLHIYHFQRVGRTLELFELWLRSRTSETESSTNSTKTFLLFILSFHYLDMLLSGFASS